MNIGILGGTFDPIHYAHLRMAEQAMEQLHFYQLMFLPCYLPNNGKVDVSSDVHRYRMLSLARMEDHKSRFGIHLIELEKEGVSYTVDTLRALKESWYPKDDLFFIMGSDEFNYFDKWKEPDEIVKLAKIVVLPRPRYDLPISKLLKYNPYVIEAVPEMDISSTGIREMVRKGKSIRYLTPDSVVKYINEQGLYK